MMKTAIMTDTNSGVTIEEARQRGLYVLPMPVIIDGNDYLEGIDVTHADLYTAMRAGKDIHSSQPAPGDFIDMWKRILTEGYDELVYIPMSAGLSGSYETACSFANAWSGQVFVVNNRRISVTLYESVLEAHRMAQQGMNAASIKASLEAHAADSSIYITVNRARDARRSSHCGNTQLEAGAYNPGWETGRLRKGTRYEKQSEAHDRGHRRRLGTTICELPPRADQNRSCGHL